MYINIYIYIDIYMYINIHISIYVYIYISLYLYICWYDIATRPDGRGLARRRQCLHSSLAHDLSLNPHRRAPHGGWRQIDIASSSR